MGIYHRDLESVRKHFINTLITYRKIKGHAITVVFDGHGGVSLKDSIAFEGGIRIIFTSTGKKADDLIKEIIQREKKHFIVVSSDRQIAEFAWSKGCVPIRSEDFLNRVESTLQKGLDEKVLLYEDEEPSPKSKKGSPYRLSKKQKAIMRALNKL